MHFTFVNRKNAGNTLIAVSLLGLLWIYAPLLPFLFPAKSAVVPPFTEQDSIAIPAISAYAKLTFNVDPWRSKEYSVALENGVAHAKGTPLPGENGTSYLFAHSSQALWRITHTNTPFLFLGNLKTGDEIEIRRNNVNYKYLVVGRAEVWPNEVGYLINKTDGVDLILQTCTPLGTALKRLLVFAKLAV